MAVPSEDADTTDGASLQIAYQKDYGGIGIKQLLLINKGDFILNVFASVMTDVVFVVFTNDEIRQFVKIFCTDLPNGVLLCLCNEFFHNFAIFNCSVSKVIGRK